MGCCRLRGAQLRPGEPTFLEVRPDQPVTVVLSASHQSPVFLVPPTVAVAEARIEMEAMV